MTTHLKIVFVTCLFLLILMEEFKPVLAKKGEQVKQRTKKLETSMAEVKDKIKILEECQSCSKINELNDTINELQKKVGSKQKLAECGDPGVPVHGFKTGENYWAWGMVTFTCDAGYHLEGPTNLLCLENGTWNNAPPKCHRLCNEPAPPENGNRVGSEFWEGKSVTYKCNKGYELQGPTVRVCNETGEWTGEEPTCNLKYAPSPAVAGLEDSEILKKDASYLKALGDFLKPVVHSNSHWKRCWQASQDGSEATTFHALCDGKGPTVTIIRVSHKYIFGGYTSLSWGGSCKEHYDSAAFLYSLVNYPGWQPVKLYQTGKYSYTRSSSIKSCPSYGPTFGGGHDIYIADHGESRLGWSYGPPTGYSYGSASSFLAGTWYFQPDEMEVFYETT